MPAKRRAAKRRLTAEAEVEAWGMTFLAGCDFSDDLAEIGLSGSAYAGCPEHQARHRAFVDAQHRAGLVAYALPDPAGDAASRALYEAARAAWHRLGDRWLQTRHDGKVTPWALEAFGEPGGRDAS